MPARAVEMRQLFAHPWSSAAGLTGWDCTGANVASGASPSSGCAAMGASALIFFLWRRGDELAGSLWPTWVLPAVRCGFRSVLTTFAGSYAMPLAIAAPAGWRLHGVSHRLALALLALPLTNETSQSSECSLEHFWQTCYSQIDGSEKS